MAEITLDQDQIIQNVNERITQDLAAAIKQVAKDGVWDWDCMSSSLLSSWRFIWVDRCW